MKSIFSPLRIVLILLILIPLLPPGRAYAGKKKEKLKELAALSAQVEEAGKKGDLPGALKASEDALAFAEKSFGEKSQEAAQAMNNTANLYMFSGHPANAEQLYKNSLVILTDKLKSNDPQLADSFYNLAMAYAMQKKYSQARTMLDRAYRIRLEKLGPDAPETKKVQQAQEQLYKENITA